MNQNKIKEIEINISDLKKIEDRIAKRELLDEDYILILEITRAFAEVYQQIKKKNMTIKKLQSILFGKKTEKNVNITKKFSKKADTANTANKKKGHGRNGPSRYPGAQTIIANQGLPEKGSMCPAYCGGKLYPVKKPENVIHFYSSPPIQADIYKRGKMRCNKCGKIFKAELPEKVMNNKYDETSAAMIALLKYGCGFPFYRLAKLQMNLGIPLPTTTQWDILENFADRIYPVFDELIRKAAQGKIIHNDDTTNKILSLQNDIKNNEKTTLPSRAGIFTSGFISRSENYDIAVFFTGNKHAGENMNDLLKNRRTELEKPIQMCDALSRNQAKDFEVILANCLTHGRRYFVEAYNNFPEQCGFVIKLLGKVYLIDEFTRKNNMTPDERLKYHKDHSATIMNELYNWLNKQFDDKLAEPNSGLGTAISYMLKHWEKLTRFLEVAGAPLDNNICERALKKIILHRKNSLFFKTQFGAYIGDIFMSLIHTCNLLKVNAFHYLTAIYKNCGSAFKYPENWMPWNYTNHIANST